MLKGKLLHPDILQVLAISGHGSKVLIADGNYPFLSGSSDTARKVFVNVMPGVPKVTEVLEALVSAIPLEAAEVMVPPDGAKQSIHDEFKRILPVDVPMTSCKRMEFYEKVKQRDTTLVIATGEQRRFANLLLTIGVVKGE
jgi:L-fucose mutarotase